MYESTQPCAVVAEDNCLTFNNFSTRNTFLNLNHYFTSKSCKWRSQVPISGLSDLEVSQDTLDPARWSTRDAGLNTHASTYTNICLLCAIAVFEWSVYWHLLCSKSSQESPCPFKVKLISVLCLILGLYKRKWEKALLVW